MPTPDLLTETDFLVREFPAPANPHRPLAIVAPRPDEDRAAVAVWVERLARRGFGGVVLDPARFGLGFLGEDWFNLVGLYVEACRLVGLFLWLLDGFTAGTPLGGIFDEALPGWRGQEITSLRVPVESQDRLDLTLAEPAGDRLLAVVARSAEEDRRPPLNLLPYVSGGRLQWDPPAGRWEIVCLRAGRAQGSPAAAFRWSDAALVSSWLKMGFAAYHELFGPHLGRTIQGFFTYCPTWPLDGAWPMLAPGDPSRQELAGLLDAPDEAEAYFTRVAEALLRSYQAPLREWCWRHRLRLAGYRLGGLSIPGIMADFDLGGLPDLNPGTAPDLPELAGLAGLARYYRQERVACQVPLSGEAWHDRMSLGRLAAAGADLFLLRPQEEAPPDYELALNDYAARVAMAIAAGGAAEQAALVVGASPAALRAAGETALTLAAKGVEAICLPAAEAVSLDEVNQGTAETAAAGSALTLPVRFPLRARKVENWTVHTLFNLGRERWRGPLDLPDHGTAEIWCPSTGEQRSAPALAERGILRLPLALEPGEAMTVVLRRPGTPNQSAPSQLIHAHLNLGRNWHFEAPGGNILPLLWREQAPGSWRAAFSVLAIPAQLYLADKPAECGVWLNGSLISPDEHGVPLHRQAVVGENILEIIGAREEPASRLVGHFVCRGTAVTVPPDEMAGPWTLNGYPHFAGPGVYRQSFEVPAEMVRPDLAAWLEISALADSAAVALNGEPVGFLPWPPYRLDLGPADRLKPGQNLLEIEVHAPAAKPAWAFKGLLGEVSLLIGEAAVEVKDPFAL